jgi:hypothetical protein
MNGEGNNSDDNNDINKNDFFPFYLRLFHSIQYLSILIRMMIIMMIIMSMVLGGAGRENIWGWSGAESAIRQTKLNVNFAN